MEIHEENFIPLLQKHNPDALVYAMQTYGGLVKSIVTRYAPEEAEECMDDVFLAVWEHIGQFQPQRNTFKNWIAAIAKYKSIDVLRKKRLPTTVLQEDTALSESAEDAVLRREVAADFSELLSCLAPADRELFLAIYIREETPNAVAKRLGIRTSALYNRLSRGRRKLRKGRGSL